MRTTTLANLRAEVRQRADIENDPHITDAEVNRFVNQSGAALHAMCVDYDEGYFLTSNTITTISGTDAYVLSNTAEVGFPNFYKLLHVEVQINGIWRVLDRWTFERRTLYLNATSWGAQQVPLSYRLSFDNSTKLPRLTFSPIPDGAYTVTVYYVPAFPDMTGDTDVFDGADGWEEWVVLDAAIKCLLKEESDTSALVYERDQVWKRIQAQMANRDLDHPSKVRDVELANSLGAFRFQIGS